ncbi:tRNA 5-methylaminomethyl-2-thiouridine biosynthesis bifunctional protein MnmC [Polaribacter huanghezhanensis]|uniref:tRNA (5-methylaminomethyl-2-thiouridine)(34)-methyltransferase MnmD n=1 Tax=Polaribacter huanghezhanensis TaxID=1354726 RepID=UPI002648199B|nr:tRNA (5-methylaminomethyl-2-thiouridine)(34)-methyltransferase MnmD [Polaribacter huanghezhanensis]WKD85939.1 tRNA 5-methylaminomethyl-2-thiouridine biosynthesis bifunctional protein MnmC [Polaribacter huanghezhanensis]
MKREIVITADGSSTIHLPDWNENYHSTHGAIQEAKHVFISKGLEAISASEISLLEIGFGTGLNCFITFLEAQKKEKLINYVGVEAFPVTKEEVSKLNYVSELKAKQQQLVFDEIHNCHWEEKHQIHSNFWLTKRKQFFKDIVDENQFELIYFDAFGAEHQPELWTVAIFKKMFKALRVNGILVTYSAKGSVRRAMQEVGFTVERLDGPPGKREMLRGTKYSA